jgi:iron complex outermembrane recepter protein
MAAAYHACALLQNGYNCHKTSRIPRRTGLHSRPVWAWNRLRWGGLGVSNVFQFSTIICRHPAGHMHKGLNSVKKFSKLKTSAAPFALGLALIASPAFAQDSAPQDSADAEADEGQVIVVTGSRIQSPNLTAAAPVTAIGADDIKASGTGKVEDILNSLPQVFAAQSSTLSNGATGTAQVDLRGLGPSRTLVLINGRRLMTGDPNSTSSAADLNFIPASMVKRVDVLTGGASATYGADAVSGVVNFIMDTEFQGFRIDANYSFYQHNNRNKITPPLLDARRNAGFSGFNYPTGSVTDGGTFDVTASFGGSFDDDRGHFMAYAGYRKANPVLQSNRDYSACTVQLNDGAGNGFTAGSPRQCGGSATSATGTAFYFVSSTTSSTVGALGPGTLTQGTLNRYNFAPLNYFQRPDERYTAGVFADYEISEAIHPYMEFMFMDDRTLAQIAPSGDFGNTLTINCDNPLLTVNQSSQICTPSNFINGFIGSFPTAQNAGYNPNPGNPAINFIDPFDGHTYNRAFFQVLRRNVEGGPRINDLKHQAFRTVIGVKGDISDAWSYDAYYQYGRTSYSQVYSNEFSIARLTNALDVVDDPRVAGVQPICRVALTGQDTNCVPYDLFGGTPSAAALNYVDATGFQDGFTSQQIVSVSLVGDLGKYGMKFPWAQDGVSIALGGEYRKDSLELKADNAFNTGDLTGQGAPTLDVAGHYSVTEFLTEINVPIVQEGFVHDLSLNGAYRYSHYEMSNGRTINTDTYKFAIAFAPVSDIRIRATYNRAVRVPNIQELFAPTFVGLDGVTDPCSGVAVQSIGCQAQGLGLNQGVTANPAGQYNGLLGGNPNLDPEVATTKTIGVVIQPRFMPGFSLTVDWFDIKIKEAIQGYGADAILAACGTSTSLATPHPACALINRDPAGSLWLTSFGYVEDLQTNVGGVRTRGVELNANYSRQLGGLGTLSLSMVGTYLDKYETDNGLTPVYDCAGYYGPTCATVAPEWRHRARLSLKMKNGIGLSFGWRYFGAVDIEYKNPSTTLAGPFYTFDERIGSQSYFDFGINAKVGRHFSWQLGVNNILDKEPPLTHSGSGAFGQGNCASTVCNGNTYPGTYDGLGRYIYTGVTLDF